MSELGASPDRRVRPQLLLLVGLALAAAASLMPGALAARDLTVSLEAIPNPASDNASMLVNVTVNNTGGSAAGPVFVELFLDGIANSTQLDYGNIPADSNESQNVTLLIPCGNHELNATVDPSPPGQVPENNESNNNFSLPLRVTPFVNFTTILSGPLGDFSLALDASSSHGCEPLNYTWTVEGVVKYGATATYNPPAGAIGVTLAVTPADTTLAATLTRAVLVPNLGPSLNASLPDDSILTLVPLQLAIAADDQDGAVNAYFIDFGDGNTTTSLSAALTYAYHGSGTFAISVTATDNLGATNETNLTIHIANRAPTIATSFPYWVTNQGDEVKFNASGSSDPEGGALTFAWAFGDGTTATGPTANHVYTTPGTYHANLTVTDADGTSTTTTMDITVLGTASDSGSLLLWGVIILVPLLLLLLLLLLMLRRRKKEPEPPKSAEGEGISGKPPSP